MAGAGRGTAKGKVENRKIPAKRLLLQAWPPWILMASHASAEVRGSNGQTDAPEKIIGELAVAAKRR